MISAWWLETAWVVLPRSLIFLLALLLVALHVAVIEVGHGSCSLVIVIAILQSPRHYRVRIFNAVYVLLSAWSHIVHVVSIAVLVGSFSLEDARLVSRVDRWHQPNYHWVSPLVIRRHHLSYVRLRFNGYLMKVLIFLSRWLSRLIAFLHFIQLI